VIHHVIMFKWQPNTSATQVDAAAQALLGLGAAIPGVIDATFGATLPGSEFHHGMVIVLKDEESFREYLKHPAHIAVVEGFLNPIRQEIQAFDFQS
jgi:hypothetical protein